MAMMERTLIMNFPRYTTSPIALTTSALNMTGVSMPSWLPKHCAVLRPGSQSLLAIPVIPLKWPESAQAELPPLWN